jgi:hypothetical protein
MFGDKSMKAIVLAETDEVVKTTINFSVYVFIIFAYEIVTALIPEMDCDQTPIGVTCHVCSISHYLSRFGRIGCLKGIFKMSCYRFGDKAVWYIA